MALARARRNETGFNYWPGFVDALSTLVLSIVFLLSVFLVVQFFLSQEVTGKDKALEELNAKIAKLNDLLSVEKLGKLNLDDQVSQLRAGLASAQAERDRVKGLYEGLAGAGSDAAGRANELNRALDSEKQVSSRALAQIEVLNQQISALRRQLAALEEALEASEKRDKESQGRMINRPLFKSIGELSSARAIWVVQYLISLGVPAQRLVAAGFAEFQPFDAAATEDAYKRNRRIELKLTER